MKNQVNQYITFILFELLKLVCQNNLPTDFVNSTSCPMSCDEWSGKIGNRSDYCNEDWSTRRDCVPTTSGKIKNYCQLSCNSSTCGRFSISRQKLNYEYQNKFGDLYCQ